MVTRDKVMNDYTEFATIPIGYHNFNKDQWVVWAVRRVGVEAEVHIITNIKDAILRWGVVQRGGPGWWCPPEPQPLHTITADSYADTRFVTDELLLGGPAHMVQIRLFNIGILDQRIDGIAFVLHRGDTWFKSQDGGDLYAYFDKK